MPYKLELNLQKRAALKIAISFWKKTKLENEIKAYVQAHRISQSQDINRLWRKFTKTALDEWNKVELPQHVKVELIHVIKMISITMCNWFHYVKHEFGPKHAVNCINNIHWTPYGTVDVVKVFKSFWLNNPNFSIVDKYTFACNNMLEKYIDDLWDQIPQDKRVNNFSRMYARSDVYLVAYWKHRKENNLINLGSLFILNSQNRPAFDFIYNSHKSLDVNMLRLSVYEGHLIATKYFWEKITEDERNDCVVECARKVLVCFDPYAVLYEGTENYKNSQYIEIYIFLQNKMSTNQRDIFLNETNDSFVKSIAPLEFEEVILKMILYIWPWQELVMPALKFLLQSTQSQNTQDAQTRKCKMVHYFLNDITKLILFYRNLNYSLKIIKYNNLLCDVWNTIPDSMKQTIVQDYSNFQFLDNLIAAHDVDSLDFILNDKSIVDSKDKLIESGLNSYINFILNDQFYIVDEFIDKLFRSEEEKKKFKQKIDIWKTLIMKGDFDLANKLLDWNCNTHEEQKSIKNKIDHKEICSEIVSVPFYEFELLYQFFDWKFDTEEEKENCKEQLKNDEFFHNTIVEIWLFNYQDIEEATKRSSEFVHWILKSDEEILRLKKQLIPQDEMDMSFSLENKTRIMNIGVMEEFIHWCASLKK